jgi:hypothetical protein
MVFGTERAILAEIGINLNGLIILKAFLLKDQIRYIIFWINNQIIILVKERNLNKSWNWFKTDKNETYDFVAYQPSQIENLRNQTSTQFIREYNITFRDYMKHQYSILSAQQKNYSHRMFKLAQYQQIFVQWHYYASEGIFVVGCVVSVVFASITNSLVSYPLVVFSSLISTATVFFSFFCNSSFFVSQSITVVEARLVWGVCAGLVVTIALDESVLREYPRTNFVFLFCFSIGVAFGQILCATIIREFKYFNKSKNNLFNFIFIIVIYKILRI